MTNDIICIYHKDCIDGTTAAAVVLKKFPHARTFPLSHGCTSTDIQEILDVTNHDTHIYIVDASIGLEEIVSQGYTVTVIDHHISEHNRVTECASSHPQVTYVFDNAKSGASLTWSYLFHDDTIPELIQLVEDSDLRTQKYGEATEFVSNYLSLERNDPHSVLSLFDKNIEDIKNHGKLLAEYIRSEIDRLVLAEPLAFRIGNHEIPVYNITNHQSVCGNVLAGQKNSCVGMYTILGDEVRFSFRSQDHHEPSSLALAETLGGGGHRNSAGARIPLHDFVTHIIQ